MLSVQSPLEIDLVDVGTGDLVDQIAVDVAQLAAGVVGDDERWHVRCCCPQGDLLGVVSRFGGPFAGFLGAEGAGLGAQSG